MAGRRRAHVSGPAVVGREPELARLTAWFRRAGDGFATRVLVSGPGGIGKTVLVDAFAARCEGAVVVRVDAGGTGPGALVTDLLAALGTPPAHHAAAPDEAASALLAALGEHQDHGPLVVVLHDVHEADERSAEIVARAFRRLQHDRVLLVATARSGSTGRAWTRFFAEGADADVLRLGGLDEQGVRDLVTRLRPGRWSRGAVARLRADTDGHPLHLTTVLRELSDEVLLGDAPLPAPRSLAVEVADVVARLPPGARRLLACLAVLGGPARRGLLARLTALADVPIDDAARELVAAGLVDGPGPESGLRVHHPLVRSAVRDGLDPAERSLLHRDVARAVGGSAGLAHRVAAADGHPDPDLADELEAAARADAVDPAAAATRLLAASDLSATGADAERRLLAAGVLLVDAYDLDRLSALAPAVRAAVPGPERDVVLGFLLSQEQDPAATVHLQTALDAEEADPEVRALAGVRLALEHVFRGRGSSAGAAAAAVPALTRRPVRVEQARILQAVGRAQRSGPDAGLAVLEGHVDGALGADPAITAGTLLLAAGRITEARARLEEGLTRARRGAASTSTHRAHCHLVEVLFRTGRWHLAEAEADVALDWFVDGDRPWAESLAHAVAVLVPAARGQADRVEHGLAAARASLARTFNPQGAHAVALAEATLARALDDPARMARAVRDLPAAAARGGMTSAPFAPWRPLHAEALVATGDVAGARRAVRCWPRTAAPLWFRLARCGLQARIALAVGDAAGAVTALRAGVALGDDRAVEAAEECPRELAELRAQLGALPHTSDAAEQLAAARVVFVELGDTPWLERIVAAPRGDEPHRGVGVERSLTPRERQVAGLVAQGMTSREAAEVLWVTAKAVDYHLGNVYSKLGISSRRQLRGRSFP